MASLALLFRRRSLWPASRRRQLRLASSNSAIAWKLHACITQIRESTPSMYVYKKDGSSYGLAQVGV